MTDPSTVTQSARRGDASAALEQAVANYYSELSDAQSVEEREWAEFALSQLQA